MPKLPLRIRLVFLFLILLSIAFNFKGQWPYLQDCAYRIKTHQIDQIGAGFRGLSGYLRRADEAGYMSCRNSAHPFSDVAVMEPYQQAQFVLSPTILDYFHPLDYSYIILECPQKDIPQGTLAQLSSYKILSKADGVLLFYRKQASR
jgi:hypothetical protein